MNVKHVAMKRPDAEGASSGSSGSSTANGTKRRLLASPLRNSISSQQRKTLGKDGRGRPKGSTAENHGGKLPPKLPLITASKRSKERLLVKKALGLKAKKKISGTPQTAVNGNASGSSNVRVLPKRKCDKDGLRTTRMWVSDTAEETRTIKLNCSSAGVADVFRRIEQEKEDRAKFVASGSGIVGVDHPPPQPLPSGSGGSSAPIFPLRCPPSVTANGMPPGAHVKRGLDHDRRRRMEDFKKMTRLSKFSHRVSTFLTAPKVYHDGMWWHTGDIVSATGTDLRTYYAQIRGFFCDQYGEKSCVLTWLVPKKPIYPPSSFASTSTERLGEFDPALFVIAYDEEEPRKLDCLSWVCRAPSDYFRPLNAPYHTTKESNRGFVWTRVGPVEARIDELEKARSEAFIVKQLEERKGASWSEALAEQEEKKKRAPPDQRSQISIIQQRVRDLLMAKHAEQTRTKEIPQLKLGEVAFVPAPGTQKPDYLDSSSEPSAVNASSEDLCVMSRGTLNALTSRRVAESSGVLEQQFQTLFRIDSRTPDAGKVQTPAKRDKKGAEEKPERERERRSKREVKRWGVCEEVIQSPPTEDDEEGNAWRDEVESGIEEDRSGDCYPGTGTGLSPMDEFPEPEEAVYLQLHDEHAYSKPFSSHPSFKGNRAGCS